MAAVTESLGPEESRLVGKWILIEGNTREDDVSQRIRSLVQDRLVRLGTDASGWETLYQDPTDGRLWELIYPQGELHGGGPPTLVVISAPEAAQKYGAVVPSNLSLERTREP